MRSLESISGGNAQATVEKSHEYLGQECPRYKLLWCCFGEAPAGGLPGGVYPGEVLGSGEFRFGAVVFDVANDVLQMGQVADDAVVALLFPVRSGCSVVTVDLVRYVALDKAKGLFQRIVPQWFHDRVGMVGITTKQRISHRVSW